MCASFTATCPDGAVRLADIRCRPSATRLQPGLLYDERGQGKCLACHLCESACRTDCLYIEEEPAQVQDREKRPRVVEIDLARCLFCGQCVDSCPERAIALVARTRLRGDLRWNMVRGEYVNS
jgi:formate hydrogenlyase subunit 6/NADH:ubiquinone oxidoreductase subunit I